MDLKEMYFRWLVTVADTRTFDPFGRSRPDWDEYPFNYEKLYRFLHSIEFTWILPKDENRAADGKNMRYKFAIKNNCVDVYEEELTGPCTVMEMMTALAVRCEEQFMCDPSIGDRTNFWFGEMLWALGFDRKTASNTHFDEKFAAGIIDRFLKREYEKDGTGSLYKLRRCKPNQDAREVEIWCQLCWYVDEWLHLD